MINRDGRPTQRPQFKRAGRHREGFDARNWNLAKEIIRHQSTQSVCCGPDMSFYQQRCLKQFLIHSIWKSAIQRCATQTCLGYLMVLDTLQPLLMTCNDFQYSVRAKGEIVILDSDGRDKGRVKRELSPLFASRSSCNLSYSDVGPLQHPPGKDIIDLTLNWDDEGPSAPLPLPSPVLSPVAPRIAEKRKVSDSDTRPPPQAVLKKQSQVTWAVE